MSKKNRLTKQTIERTCRKAGLTYARRTEIQGVESHLWDGFISPLQTHWLERFGVGETEFPDGCWMTVAVAMKSEDAVTVAEVLMCEKDHNPELSPDMKKVARLNSGVKRLQEKMPDLKRIMLDA